MKYLWLLLASSLFGQTITVAPNPNNVKPSNLAAAVAIESTLHQPIVITLGPGVYVTPMIALPDDSYCANIHGAGPGITTLRPSGAIINALITKGAASTPVGCQITDLTIDMLGQTASCWEIQKIKGLFLAHVACLNSASTIEASGVGNTTKAAVFYEALFDDVYISTTAPVGLHLYFGATDSEYRDVRIVGAKESALKNEGAANDFLKLHPYGNPKYCVEDYGRNLYDHTECDTFTVSAFHWLGTMNSKATATMLVQVGTFSFAPDYPPTPTSFPSTCLATIPSASLSNGTLFGTINLGGCQ